MIYAIYIAAAMAVGLLIGFVALSIIWLRKTVSNNIRSKTVGLLSVYDDLLEEKSRELAAIEADLQQHTDSQPGESAAKPGSQNSQQPSMPTLRASEMLDMAERSGGAVYRDEAVGSVYRKIRGHFSFRVEELLPVFTHASAAGGPAGKLLSELDFDTVFRLSTMPEEDQKSILREAFSPEEIALLDAYLETHSVFHVLEFYDSLRSIADTEPKPACLRVPAGVVPEAMTRDGVQIVPDSEICEGFQLEDGNFLYDYCIKSRELR